MHWDRDSLSVIFNLNLCYRDALLCESASLKSPNFLLVYEEGQPLAFAVYIVHRMKFVNGLEIGIRSMITKLHNTLIWWENVYQEEIYTKLYQTSICKTIIN